MKSVFGTGGRGGRTVIVFHNQQAIVSPSVRHCGGELSRRVAVKVMVTTVVMMMVMAVDVGGFVVCISIFTVYPVVCVILIAYRLSVVTKQILHGGVKQPFCARNVTPSLRMRLMKQLHKRRAITQ